MLYAQPNPSPHLRKPGIFRRGSTLKLADYDFEKTNGAVTS